MLKRVFCIVTSLTLFLIISFSPLCLSSHASKYENIPPYSEAKFSVPSAIYSHKYILLVANSSNQYELLLMDDYENETIGYIKVSTDINPLLTKILWTDYRIYPSGWVSSGSSFSGFNYSGNSFSGFVFDYYNSDKFPTYSGGNTYVILASNVDIYDYNGRLLQSGNYNTLMKYFDYNIVPSRIKDYTSASEPQTTTTSAVTTTPASSSGSSGDSETSKGILSKVKEIAENIANLPQNIASSIGNFFTDLKNSISSGLENLKDRLIDGIEYLFKPSDNNFTEIQEIFEDKFKFATQIIGFFKDFTDVRFLDKPPDTNITIYGQTISFINWDLYDRYKGFVDTIIISCSYYFYIRRLIKRLPGIIGGFHT